ncbi:flagellar protein FlhE [Micromonospora sp. NPDC023956]|uniref:flagellar protein FlhE n=1 Tax=Micromonospora sp. NPDC023956 TaxID=3155722 RepID=UPI003402AA90
MTTVQRLGIVIAAVIAVLLPTSAAHASDAAYVVNPTGTVLHQTNWWYSSTTVNAPTGTPAASSIDTIYWTYSISNQANVIAQLCNPDGPGQLLCLDLPNGWATGNTTAWAGLSAQRGWLFRLAVLDPVTKILSPYRYGGQHQVIVNWSYTTPSPARTHSSPLRLVSR